MPLDSNSKLTCFEFPHPYLSLTNGFKYLQPAYSNIYFLHHSNLWILISSYLPNVWLTSHILTYADHPSILYLSLGSRSLCYHSIYPFYLCYQWNRHFIFHVKQIFILIVSYLVISFYLSLFLWVDTEISWLILYLILYLHLVPLNDCCNTDIHRNSINETYFFNAFN
jgi:hypothetical protein